MNQPAGDAAAAGEGYAPIAEHGLIGDLRTAALVGADGTIDWFCCPRFDSPSVFGAILDHAQGGHWQISARGPATTRQFYMPDSNVLVTRFFQESGVLEVCDFMPVVKAHDHAHRQRLVRRVKVVRGHVSVDCVVAPRFDYGRGEHTVERPGEQDDVVEFVGPDLQLRLFSSAPLEVRDGMATATFTLGTGEVATFCLDVRPNEPAEGSGPVGDIEDSPVTGELMRQTIDFWQTWLAGSTYTGRWRESVHRSALVLKLLCHEPSGAIIAAPTMGLPEEISGERNWDYRYVWIRDAAFSLYALLRLGFTDEAEAFMSWLTERFMRDGDESIGPIRVMYDIDGNCPLGEVALDHWEGHRKSAPVRVGNDAADQLQLDIYGELIDSIYLYNKYSLGISLDAWHSLTKLVSWLSEHWDQPDEGIWETRSGRRDHTYSRLMCWVTVERMIRMAAARGLPGDVSQWRTVRDAIFADILECGWSEERGAFVRDFDSAVVDASLLMMPLVKFIAPNDPRYLGTVAAVEESLVTDSLVFRYDPQVAATGSTARRARSRSARSGTWRP